MGIIELVLVIAALWCALLAFGTALFAVAARADQREDTFRGPAHVATATVSETAPVKAHSPIHPSLI